MESVKSIMSGKPEQRLSAEELIERLKAEWNGPTRRGRWDRSTQNLTAFREDRVIRLALAMEPADFEAGTDPRASAKSPICHQARLCCPTAARV
jgi:hypothetical protein